MSKVSDKFKMPLPEIDKGRGSTIVHKKHRIIKVHFKPVYITVIGDDIQKGFKSLTEARQWLDKNAKE